ncbi:hypothetical protein [Deinococcus sp. LM3]|uniref:hypothetical protein n=1 Tax=Deinococcus sp. LM3 TaxID=1938608 RepID=UPI0032046C21
MRRQLIQHQHDPVRCRVPHVQRLELCRELGVASPFRDRHGALTHQRFKSHEEIHCASACIHDRPVPGIRHGWQRIAHVIEHLVGLLIEADHRPTGIVGQGVRIQYGFHPPHEVCAYLSDTPLSTCHGLRTFFSACAGQFHH